ncbi:MAG: 2-oxoacid:acceptor oxidoreductase family protein [Thiohalomonadaceae bacterium]
MKKETKTFKYPGKRRAMDGNTAVIMCERESSDAAGAYPITPSTNMGEYWAEEVSKGHINVSDRPLIFIEPESEHAAAAVTAGLSMTGLRATNFSSAQGVAFMHESLYSAVGKRLTYVLNIGCRAITKATLNVHAGHDDYHCVDDTGFFQVMAKSAQEAADLNMIAHKVAELSLTPGIVAQDGFLTTHLIESMRVPERALIAEFLGRPDDLIDTPTPAQRLIYGPKRRRIPSIWDVDNPMVSGAVQNQDAYMQAVAAQRPYFFEHIKPITDQAMEEFYQLTGRRYGRIGTYKTEDADYVIIGQGSVVGTAEAVADYLRETRKLKVGVVNLTMFRPFPGDLLGHVLKGKKGVAVLERTDQPLAEDLPLARETRATVSKCVENGVAGGSELPYPDYAAFGAKDIPVIYSGSFGLGSRDLQPEGIIAAVENMLPDGKHRKFFYLGVDFVREKPDSPKQEIYQQDLLEAYPRVRELALRGSENPNLMPKGAITVRMHSVGGWGAVTTGKNLAMTLFELLDYDIKANPKYGSEKKGQPTTYYLSAAPEPIRINAEYKFVDVVLSPDPNVFSHSNALAGLKKGGVFIIQSHLETPEEVWRSFPITAQRFIVENDIRVFYVDAFKIAREEASNPELQFRMQGIAFQGAFFKASGVMEQANLDEHKLFKAIKDQLESKFGSKGARVVEDNLRVVRRGFDELKEITEKAVGQFTPAMLRKESHLPVMLKRTPESSMSLSDVHRFWEQTGNFYISGQGNDNLVDPFIGLSIMPAATGVFRDMTQVRFEHPTWNPANCTACGDCYTVCPDSAIPGLVNSMTEVFETAIRRIETAGNPTRYLRRATRTLEKKLRALLDAAGEKADVHALLAQAIVETIVDTDVDGEALERLNTEFEWFKNELGEFKFAVTKPYYLNKEKQAKGSGGLFSITVNPYTCKGCMECVTVCGDDALSIEKQTPESVERLRKEWNLWLDLPTTSPEYIRIEDLDERIGALETLLLDKRAYGSMVCGDGACLGCGEKTALHLFTATVTALMQPRVKAHLAKLDQLINGLDRHIRLKLAETMDLSDTEAVSKVVEAHEDADLTLARLTAKLDEGRIAKALDPEWLKWATQLLARLKDLKWRYTDGVTGRGRAEMGIVNSTGCTSVWGSTFPFSPYPFPWASHLFQDSPSMAMGLFEGHMAKMAEGFKAIRMAELELAGEYNAEKHKDFFTYFDWKQFSDEEWLLCPPVVSVGGDGAMYDIGFQNLSRALMSGIPIKVMVLDTQAYSNTGGQSCTSGYLAQVADMAPYGKQWKGKVEIRKEMSLIAMAHRTSYVMQGGVSNVTHLIESFIEGLNSRRPALFNVYAVCQPEHGVGDDKAYDQTKLAMEARAYPLLRFNPDKGNTWRECLDLEGNPSMDTDWPMYTLDYINEKGEKAKLEVPMTFADFAVTEGRFRKHFKKAPAETWNENMVPVHEFLELDEDERDGKYPYIWTVDQKQRLGRVLVSQELVNSCIERRDFWRLLKSIAGLDKAAVNADQIAEQTRQEMAQRLTAGLLALAGGQGVGEFTAALAAPAGGNGAGTAAAAAPADYEPAWVDSPECTSCDECIKIAPAVFAYNDQKKAVVVNPKGCTYKDLVRAAEKCTAGCIHPGTPFNPAEPDLEKLKKRAEKFH